MCATELAGLKLDTGNAGSKILPAEAMTYSSVTDFTRLRG